MRIAKGLLLLLAVWFALAAAFSGCTCVVNNYRYGTARPSAMFVANAPPAAKDEVRPAAPSGDHVWIKGHWEWSVSEETWIWAVGFWAVPPDEGATWVDPEYGDNNGDWMYVPGHWRWNDPGAEEGAEAATPALPPGDLRWAGKRDVDGPDGGEAAAPAKPMVPPGGLTAEDAESQPKAEVSPGAKPIKTVESAVGPTEPDGDGGARKEDPSHVVEAPGLSADDDPYGAGEDDGDDGAKKHKKKKHENKEAAKPDGGKPVQEKPRPPKPVNTVIEDVLREMEVVRQCDDEQPAPKPAKKHKAKPEKKGDHGAAPKAKIEDAPKAKSLDKIKVVH